MGVTDKFWDAITTVIRMNDKVERMAASMVTQQQKIEGLTERVIRLETALKIAMLRKIHPVGVKPVPSQKVGAGETAVVGCPSGGTPVRATH